VTVLLIRWSASLPTRQAQTADDGAPVGFVRQGARVDCRPGSTWPRHSARQGRICQAPALRPGVSSSSPIWSFLKLPGAKVHCTSGVADSSNTFTEAATIEEL